MRKIVKKTFMFKNFKKKFLLTFNSIEKKMKLTKQYFDKILLFICKRILIQFI